MLASIVSYTLVYYCGGEESGESGGGGGGDCERGTGASA